MIHVQRVNDMEDPRVEAYRNVREADLRGRHDLFIAEGRLVVGILVSGCRFRAESILVTEPALQSLLPQLEAAEHTPEVYVADLPVMSEIVGFDIHRGCLAAGRRRPVPNAEQLLGDPESLGSLIVGVEDLSNHDNIGGIFRNAAAFGASGILLTPRCCDPLYRKSIRVSMGHVLRLPYATLPAGAHGVAELKRLGWTTIALTPRPDAMPLGEAMAMLENHSTQRVCLLLGGEGSGLSSGMLNGADFRVRIPMSAGVDSLNTAVAGAIAMQRLAEQMGGR